MNFLLTADVQRNLNCGTLRYVAFEKFPLGRAAIARALAPWTSLPRDLVDDFLEDWPVSPAVGVNKIISVVNGGDTTLEVHIGDANQAVRALASSSGLQADAWYLDGFNPSSNTDLWGVELMGHVFACTKSGGTFSTYTAAGWVRRNLSGAGFVVERVAGFGRKRHRAQGHRPLDSDSQN